MKSSFLGDALFIFVWKLYDGHPCGQAGSFTNIGSQEISYESQIVSYSCTYDGVLFGNRKRFCQTNGTWTGTIPVCVRPASNFVRSVNQSSIDSSQDKNVRASECLNDRGKTDPCISLEPGDPDKLITIHFHRLYKIVAVRLSYSSQDAYRSAEVYLFENSTNLVDSRGILCDNRQMDVFKCSRPIPALSMSIRFLSTLNEVYIYEKTTVQQCSRPDVPAFGRHVDELGGKVTQYSCYENYILTGNHRSECLSNGTWSEPAPICRNNASTINNFSSESHSNYIIIVLGCLSGVFIFIIAINVSLKWVSRRRRNLATVPYYAWSNGTNEAPHSEQVGSARVPCPLPRNALEIDSTPLRLRPESGEADETRHYSVVGDQGDYLTILGDPKEDTRDDTSAVSNLYQECAPKRREANTDCTTIPQPPDTRFSELKLRSELRIL